MKYRPLDDGSYRVHFDTEEYRTLLDAAPHREARLAMRVMACSTRVGTTAEETYLDRFNATETPHGTLWTLHVEAKDSTDRDGALRPREVWIPDPLLEEIKEVRGVDSFDTHEPLFRVSKRTIQNWVEKARENAATATGDMDFLKVSSHDFRRYFASHMLYRHNVDAEIVRQLGGWQSPRAMMEYLLVPDDVLADELGSVGLLGAAADLRPADGTPYRERNAIETLAAEIEAADRCDARRLADRVADLFDDVSGIDVAVAGSKQAAEQAVDAVGDPSQHSLGMVSDIVEDEDAHVRPAVATKAAYVLALVTSSWSVTLAPLV